MTAGTEVLMTAAGVLCLFGAGLIAYGMGLVKLGERCDRWADQEDGEDL